MTEAKRTFDLRLSEVQDCIDAFDLTNKPFALRHVWVSCVSAFDLYMTELISEAGLRLIDRTPPALTVR